jgi:hypothetical protein
MDEREKLIFNLIFGDETNFKIDIGLFVDDIYHYEDFVTEIRNILRRSKVMVVKSGIKVDSKTATWELKVKK